MFKLNDDDEDLTHYGQTLSEIERFEEPNVSGSEDDEAGGQIGGEWGVRALGAIFPFTHVYTQF